MKIFHSIHMVFRDIQYYLFDMINDLKYTTLLLSVRNYSQEQLLSTLVVACHTIEKGLTMPKRKSSFGQKKVLTIVNYCQHYVDADFDVHDARFLDCIDILKEYLRDQQNRNVEEHDATRAVRKFLTRFESETVSSQLYNIRADKFFEHNEASFDRFSISRRSCRNLLGHVEEDKLKKALDLAMNAPSTCNRQSVRIHLIQSESAKKVIVEMHSGSRGFNELADKFIIVTSDMSAWESAHQRNAPYVDGGIFTMNLLYCLHFYRIGACALNLYLTPTQTKQLHELLQIPNNELPIVLIAIGIPPETFDLTRSKRREANEVIYRH